MDRKFKISGKKIAEYFIVLVLFLILIFANILRPVIDELYVLSFVLIALIFLLIQLFDFSYRSLFFLSIASFLTGIITLVLEYKIFPTYLANVSIYLFILGIISIYFDKLRRILKSKQKTGLFKKTLIALIILTLILPFGIYNNHIVDLPQFVKQNSLRIFSPKIYYGYGINENEENKDINNKNIKLVLDFPSDSSFYKEEKNIIEFSGWAIDFNSERGTGIDNIEFWLDGKPLDGKFLGKAKTGIERNDIAEKYGEQFRNCGYVFELDISEISEGNHNIEIWAHSLYNGWVFIEKNINVFTTLQNKKQESESILLIDNKNFDKYWTPVNQCEFKPEDNGIAILVKGDDPYFENKIDLDFLKEGDYYVEIVIETVVDSNFQLFFKTEGQEYKSENSYSQNLYIGENKIIIHLPNLKIQKIRIDPVNNNENCLIKKIEFFKQR